MNHLDRQTVQAKDMLKAVLEHCGLGGAKTWVAPDGSDSMLVRKTTGYTARIDVYFEFEINLRYMATPEEAGEEIARATEHVRASVRKSPFVAAMVDELETLRERVKELEPYETYYRLAQGLRGGL